MLFRRWHATGQTVVSTRSGQRYETAVYLLVLLFDELHTRDPAGGAGLCRGGVSPDAASCGTKTGLFRHLA